MIAHINARKEDVSELVIMLGDSLTVKYAAEKYLENPQLINNIKLILGYTGYYNNKKVTIFASGMGSGSMGIYCYELFNDYNVKKIIRVGTCGSYHEEIKLKDLIVVEKAYTTSNFAEELTGTPQDICKSSVLLSQKIVNNAHENNIDLKIGTIHTANIFYSRNDLIKEKIKENFCLGVEMECFPLFYTAKMLDKQAASILTVSNSLITNEEMTSKEKEQTLDIAIELALKSLTK